jgi:hypothetical protein
MPDHPDDLAHEDVPWGEVHAWEASMPDHSTQRLREILIELADKSNGNESLLIEAMRILNEKQG